MRSTSPHKRDLSFVVLPALNSFPRFLKNFLDGLFKHRECELLSRPAEQNIIVEWELENTGNITGLENVQCFYMALENVQCFYMDKENVQCTSSETYGGGKRTQLFPHTQIGFWTMWHFDIVKLWTLWYCLNNVKMPRMKINQTHLWCHEGFQNIFSLPKIQGLAKWDGWTSWWSGPRTTDYTTLTCLTPGFHEYWPGHAYHWTHTECFLLQHSNSNVEYNSICVCINAK